MAMTAAQLNVIFGSKGADAVKRDLRDVGDGVTRAGSGFDRLRAGALGLGSALIVPMGIGLRAAINLEQGIANINASLGGLDTATLDALAESFNDIGAASQYSATEVAAVADSLAKAGFGVDDLLNGMTQAVVDLSQATGDGLGPATEGIIQAMSTWKEGIVDADIAMTDATRVADILTIAANESSAGLTDIQAGMRSLGPVAAMMGVSYEEAAAAIALFTNNGLKGADAGISLARGLQNLANPTSEAATMMANLGIAAFDAQGNFVGFPSLFRQLQTSMAGMDQQTQLLTLSTIFGAEAMDVMGLAIMNGADPLEAMIALMDESGAAAEQSALRMDTLGAQFDTLVEGVTTFLGSLLEGLIPGLRTLVDGANDVIDVLMRIPKPIKTIIGAVAGGLAAFAALNLAMKGFALFSELSGTGGVGMSMRGFLPILGGVAAGAGALYLAWRTNFLGIRDIVEDVGDSFTEFRRQFEFLADNGVNPVSAALQGLRSVLPELEFAITPILRVVDRMPAIFEDLTYNFRQFRDAGVGPVSAALMTLGAVFPNLEGGLRPLVVAFDQFRQGDYAGMFASIGESIRAAASGVVNLVVDVAVSIGSWIIDAAQDLWSAVKEWALGTPGAPAGDGTGGATGPNGTQGALVTIAAVGVRVLDWAVDAAQDIWGRIKEAAQTAWDLVSGNYEEVGPLNIRIGEFNVEIDTAAFMSALDEETKIDDSTREMFRGAGETAGEKSGNWFMDGFNWAMNRILAGGGGGGGTGGGGGGTPMSIAAGDFFSGWLDGLEQSLFVQFDAWGGAIEEDLRQRWSLFWASAFDGAGLPEIELPSISWSGLTDGLVGALDGAIDLINGLIDQLNRIPGVNIPKLNGLDEITADADAATAAVIDLQASLNSLATSGIFTPNAAARGKMEGTDYTPYSNPYNPTEGGVNVEYQPISSMFPTPDPVAVQGVNDYAGGIERMNSAYGSMPDMTPLSTTLTDVSLNAPSAATGIDSFNTSLSTASITLLTFVGGAAALLAGFSNAVTANTETAGTALTTFNTTVTTALTGITTFVSAVAGMMAGFANAVTANVDTAISSLTALGTSTATTTTNFATMAQGVAGMAEGMANAISAASETSVGALNSVTDAANAIPKSVTVAVAVVGASGAVSALNNVAEAARAANQTVTITVQTVGAVAAGAAAGSGFLSGWDRSTRTESPSKAMEERGRYLFQGLDNGWNRESRQLPVRFDVAPATGMANGRGGASSPVVTINNHITPGAGMDEDRLATLAAERTMEAVTVAMQRQDRAMGGTI